MADEPAKSRPIAVEITSKVEVASKSESIPQRLSVWVPLFVSALALLTSVLSVYFTVRHNKLSLRPILTAAAHVGGGADRIGFSISNQGNGSAIIEDLTIIHNGNKFNPDTLYMAHNYMFIDRQHVRISTPNKALRSMVRPGETIYLLETKENNVRNLGEFHNFLQKLRLEAKYCSIYEECFEF